MNQLRLQSLLLSAFAIVLAAPVHASLPSGVSGPWYNPHQSGHGVSVEVLTPDRALLFWYVYDLAGTPMPLYVEAAISGRRIEGTAYRPSGMRFGSFNPLQLQMPVWGQISMEFDSCSEATLRWTSIDFGSGSLPMQRLAALDGLDCRLARPGRTPVGSFDITVTGERIDRTAPPLSIDILQTPGYAAIDSAGTLWAVQFLESGVEVVQGPVDLDRELKVLIARPDAGSTTVTSARAFTSHNWWGRVARNPPGDTAIAGWAQTADDTALSVDVATSSTRNGGISSDTRRWTLDLRQDNRVLPLEMGMLTRRFAQSLSSQFIANPDAFIDIDATGRICVSTWTIPEECKLEGQVWLSDPEEGFLSFELTDLRFPAAGAYRGRGWLHETARGRRLVLVGENGLNGLGFVAR